MSMEATHWWQCAVRIKINNCCGLTAPPFSRHMLHRLLSATRIWEICDKLGGGGVTAIFLTSPLPLYVLLLSSRSRARVCQTWNGGVHEVLCAHLCASVSFMYSSFGGCDHLQGRDIINHIDVIDLKNCENIFTTQPIVSYFEHCLLWPGRIKLWYDQIRLH